MTACQDINKIKQFSMRLKSFSGAFNWAFTMGYGYWKKNDFYFAANTVFKSDPTQTCTAFGTGFGALLASSLQTYTAAQTYLSDIASYGSGTGTK